MGLTVRGPWKKHSWFWGTRCLLPVFDLSSFYCSKGKVRAKHRTGPRWGHFLRIHSSVTNTYLAASFYGAPRRNSVWAPGSRSHPACRDTWNRNTPHITLMARRHSNVSHPSVSCRPHCFQISWNEASFCDNESELLTWHKTTCPWSCPCRCQSWSAWGSRVSGGRLHIWSQWSSQTLGPRKD